MNKEKYGFIYIWRDKKYNRYYIGCHWGTEDDGYICSSTWMKSSYKRRPKDFKRRILETNIQDRSKMYDKEKYWLDFIDKNEIKPLNENPRYYNLNLSRNGLWHQYPEHVKTVGQKISESKKGKKTGPRPQYVKDSISKANRGKKRTPEQIERNSKANKGKTSPRKGVKLDKETKSKISNSLKEKKQSKETIEKRTESLKKVWASKSEKQRKKIGENISKSLRYKWLVTDPDGNKIEVSNLKKYCEEKELGYTNISKQSGSKGWNAVRI